MLVDKFKEFLTDSNSKSEIVYGKEWRELHQHMFDLKHDLMKLTIESHLEGFSRDLSDYFHKR